MTTDAPSLKVAQATGPKIVVVVPTYNEAENVPELIRRLFGLGIGNLHVLVVDDGSPDGTAEVARALSHEHRGRIAVIERPGKMGLGTAYKDGFARAIADGADFVFQMDADLSHPVEELPAMLAELERADVVVGSRYVPSTAGREGTGGIGSGRAWDARRRLISKVGNLSIRLVSGLRVRDATSGFKGFRAEALRGLPIGDFRCRGFGFQAEMAFACQSMGYRVVEHPFVFSKRIHGESKMSPWIVLEAVWRLIPLRLRGMRETTRVP